VGWGGVGWGRGGVSKFVRLTISLCTGHTVAFGNDSSS